MRLLLILWLMRCLLILNTVKVLAKKLEITEGKAFSKKTICGATEFDCGDGTCISDIFVCNLIPDCANGADEETLLCHSYGAECAPNEFACGDGSCITDELVCDGTPDCNNGADETEDVCVVFICDPYNTITYDKVCDGISDCDNNRDEINCECLRHEFLCANGICIIEPKRCDGANDCGDFSDEMKCPGTCETTEFACGDGTCISDGFVCDQVLNCANGADEDSQLCGVRCAPNQFACGDGTCILHEHVCDGSPDCNSGADEDQHVCDISCGPTEFDCGDGTCISHDFVCNQVLSCPNGADEDPVLCGCAPNQFTCGDGTCILHENVCDGYSNCTDASDEDPHVCGNPLTACQKTKGSRDCLYFFQSPEEHNESAEFLKATSKGERTIENRLNKSKKLFKGNFVAKPGSATWVHQSLLNATTNTTTIINAIAIERATLAFLNILNCDEVDEERSCNVQKIFNVTFKKTTFGQKYCHALITCPTNETYRTYDGSCNNANDPLLGKAGTPLMRLLPPAYQDFFKLKEPRTRGSDGTILPSARKVSQLLKVCNGSQDTIHTMMLMQYAQFIDHDISLSPTAKLEFNGAPIECCTADSSGKLRFPQRHKECLPIPVDKKDSYYGCLKKRCMNFVRTLSAPSTGCTFGPRQQVNDVSHFLDGSNIYGSSSDTANSLRAFSGGRLLVNKDADTIDMLPPQTNGGHCKPSPEYCYKAGDSRVNEQPFLGLTHTLWVREHNRIADHFTRTGNNDEEAFQKARRLVTAELHQITFNEFLPHILGKVYTSARNLSSSPAGQYYRGYSPFTDARVSNSFATAAFRMGHSAVPDILELRWPDFAIPTKLPLSSMFFNQGLNHYWVNRLMFELGLIQQHPEKVDTCFSAEVNQKLFEESSPGSGLDLFSLDIQRGRDHGLPGYIEYRNNFCNCNKKIHSFEDMDWLSESIKSLLTKAYKNVEDVDLIVGGLLEPPEPGALVGETFQCIIGDQFHSLKAGDRYYFENDRQPFPFTIKQLDAIRSQVSLARIICDNGDGITKIQTNVFESSESLVACNNFSSILQLDLSLFS